MPVKPTRDFVCKVLYLLVMTGKSALNRKIPGSYVTTSIGIATNKNIAALLSAPISYWPYGRMFKTRTYLGWGRQVSGWRSVTTAKKEGGKFELLEDGFLRSFDRNDEALSIVVDNQGIYYDANSPSQCETLILQELSREEESRTFEIMKKWRDLRLSKYNSSPEFLGSLPARYVLVVDQVAGDLSIRYGNADQSAFGRMLRCALAENPDCIVIVKVHPDTRTRTQTGHFNIAELKSRARVEVVDEACHPVRLIENAEAVYTVTSQIGFEALIWGKRVRCFGMPFYSGWGLTNDDQTSQDRRNPVSLLQLVHGALVKYSRYFDPERRVLAEIETVMDHIGTQRSMAFQYPSEIYAIGISLWKRPILKRFLFGSKITFVKNLSGVSSDATVAVWNNSTTEIIANSVRTLRVEDGFLRSSGLGADLYRPLSWVIDDQGIYYDSTKPSQLELIFQDGSFDDSIIDRARILRQQILSAGISKYNLGGAVWRRPKNIKRVILVPGQVENDASIRLGAPEVKTNVDLLRAVRRKNSDAHIVYKPHPDVEAGLRQGGLDEECVYFYCDEIVKDSDPVKMFNQVDEVHTMTSLIGFEALLRGVSVTCYGQPFYSGWGLTIDMCPLERRTRKLSLEELVAGTLILYPRYVSRYSMRFTSPERAVEELVEWRDSGPPRISFWRCSLRTILRLWARLAQ